MPARRFGPNSRWYALGLVALGLVAGCSSGGQTPTATTTAPSSSDQTSESTAKSVTPSITRDVPPPQRQQLAVIPPDRLCDLASPDDLGRLAFPVQPGRVRDLGGQPPVRGCVYDGRGSTRSVLIGVQPQGLGQLGPTQVALGSSDGTEVQHVNDCTVLATAAGATLQVVVAGGGTDSSQCDMAQGIAQYVLADVVH
jgi:hypothetical protein